MNKTDPSGKDPAVLFYTKDFLAGTLFMTNEEVGVYIRALCYQHQYGPFSLETFNGLMGGKNKFPNVRKMFIQDEHGLWYNRRMNEEIELRKRFISRQSANAKKRWGAYDSGGKNELP